MVHEQIRAYIDEMGLKQTAIAAKMGMSKQLFGSKVRGETKFTADEYINLCHVLNVSLNRFDIPVDNRKTA